MNAVALGHSVKFTIEVEDKPKSVLLVLDRKTDLCLVPWQDAYRLADVMDRVVKDVVTEFMIAYPVIPRWMMLKQQSQIRFNHYKDLVGIVVEWTDRIRFSSLEAFSLVSRALRQCGQDAYLDSQKGIRFVYSKDNLTIRKLLNLKTQETQTIR